MSSEAFVVSPEDRAVLESWLRAGTMQAALVQRARIVLLTADGHRTGEVMERVGASRPTVIAWRNRWLAEGLAGLSDKPRSGRPPVIDEHAVVVETLNKPPEKLGVTHWSSRLLADHLGISNYSVVMIWKKYDLQPWKTETFKFSTDPELDAKVRDVVGLYMNPPAKAVVVCVDEKTQIQALDRTAPTLPMTRGRAERMTHDYKRNGTTSLFAGLDVATGRVTGKCYDRHTNAEFLDFLKLVAKAHPRKQLHIVCDNYATHKHPNIQKWLEKNPRVTMHFTPTSGSWMNMVEIFFGLITRQAIRRGVFTSVEELKTAIRTYCAGWNERCEPFVWTKDADTILSRAKPKTTSLANH